MAKRKLDERDREFSAEVYRAAAAERLAMLETLYKTGLYTLALYMAGVAVECIFRAYRCKIDPSFDSRHDLYELAKAANFQQLFLPGEIGDYEMARFEIAGRWSNNHRYRSDAAVRAFLRRSRLNRGIKGDYLKQNTRRAIDAAYFLVTVGLKKWKR